VSTHLAWRQYNIMLGPVSLLHGVAHTLEFEFESPARQELGALTKNEKTLGVRSFTGRLTCPTPLLHTQVQYPSAVQEGAM
jgi:hypothetical protein